MIILGVAVSVVAVLIIGFAVARRVHGSSTNFLVAGRALALPLSAAGLMGQAVDSNATLGNTDLTAAFGFWSGASLPLGLAICLLLTGLFFARRMNAMGLYTLGDFFRQRYGRTVEVVASVLLIASFVILLAGNLVAGGVIFDAFLGTGYTLGVLIILVVVLAYTVAGGMISDAYTAFAMTIIKIIGVTCLVLWVAVTYGFTIPDGTGPFAFEQLTTIDAGAPINWATLAALGIGDIVAIDFMQRIFSAKSPDVARQACFTAAGLTAAVGVSYSLVALTSGSILPDGAGGRSVLVAILQDAAPAWLSIIVLSALIAASCSTANGVVLGTSSIATRNIAGIPIVEDRAGHDVLLRWTRITMFPVVGLAFLMAMRAQGQTAILLVLAFDLMLACLVAAFVAGHFWPRANATAAMASIVVGVVVRVVLFVVSPTCYGLDNTILYLDNPVVGPTFDGFPTFIAFGLSIVVFVAVTLATTAPGSRAEGTAAAADDEPAQQPDVEGERV